MEYSICIRTLGKGGEKYKKLVQSINNLSIKPKEVLIVIPVGYRAPEDKIFNQRIIYGEKGMLLQRIIGIEEAATEYVLMVDDDIEFEASLIEKLYKPIKEGNAEITFPIYEELLPKRGVKGAISMLTLSAIPTLKKDSKYIKVIASGGYMYKRNYSKCGGWIYSESAPGMCIFASRQVLLDSKLREELWVENPGYALRDDTILIYKPFLNDCYAAAVKDVDITHLDNGASESKRNIKAAYANNLNHIIFWYRFVFKENKSILKKSVAVLAILYWSISITGYFIIKLFTNRDLEIFKASMKGITEGFQYIKTSS